MKRAERSSKRRGEHPKAERAAELADLPDSVLTRILQEIPLKPRLGVCARVCRAWAAAVAACTADLEHEVVDTQQCDSLQRWFSQHGQQIQVVHLTASFRGGVRPVFELPTAELTQLEHMCVDGVTLELHTDRKTAVSTRSSSGNKRRTAGSSFLSLPQPAAAAASTGAATTTAAVLPKMQHLGIKACNMAVQHLLKLSRLTTLGSLHLVAVDLLTYDTTHRKRSRKKQPDPAAALQTILQQLPCLTDLAAGGLSVHQQLDVSSITNLQHLQRLAVDSSCCPDRLVPVLPTALTALELTGIDIVAPDHLQALSRLSSLQELYLASVWLDPLFLTVCSPTLRCLFMCGIEFTTEAEPDPHPSETVPVLCSALARLTQLAALDLRGVGLLEDFPELRRLSAFSASSCLTRLRLRDESANPLPEDGLLHVLPEGRRLPELRVLHVVAQEDTGSGCVSGADLARVGEACPSLAELCLVNVLVDGQPIHGLLPLASSLTALHVHGHCWGDAAARVVAQLTALRSLCWERSRLSEDGLHGLTALRCLTSLSVRDCHHLKWVLARACWEGVNKAPTPSSHRALILTATDEAGQGPDVWWQLKRLFRVEKAGTQQHRKRKGGKKQDGGAGSRR